MGAGPWIACGEPAGVGVPTDGGAGRMVTAVVDVLAGATVVVTEVEVVLVVVGAGLVVLVVAGGKVVVVVAGSVVVVMLVDVVAGALC